LIVGGAAAGIILIANPPSVIGKTLIGAKAIVFPQSQTRESFLRALRMLYEVFAYVQRAGAMKLESDVEDPTSSPIFSNYPELLKDAPALYFLCDSLRMLVIGGLRRVNSITSWIWISKSSAGVVMSR
jgi:chemotaxis protein MotA